MVGECPFSCYHVCFVFTFVLRLHSAIHEMINSLVAGFRCDDSLLFRGIVPVPFCIGQASQYEYGAFRGDVYVLFECLHADVHLLIFISIPKPKLSNGHHTSPNIPRTCLLLLC